MIFYNNVQVDSGSDTYSKGRFPKLKAYVGPVVGSNGEDLFDGYFALNNYDDTQLKLCGGFGYKPGYCVPIGGLSIETITQTAGWFSNSTYYTGGYCSYTVINDVFGVNFGTESYYTGGYCSYTVINDVFGVNFGTESYYTGGFVNYSIINFDVNLTSSQYYILSSSDTASL